jgi:hypothetical protein
MKRAALFLFVAFLFAAGTVSAQTENAKTADPLESIRGAQ